MVKKKITLTVLVLFLVLTLPFAEALTITNVRTTDITDSSAIVRWDTGQPADGIVTFGTNATELPFSQSDFRLATTHAVPLTNLNRSTDYRFKVRSASATEVVEDTNQGGLYAFSTAAQDVFPPRIAVDIPLFSNRARIDVVGETEFDVDLRLFHNNALIRAYRSTNAKIEFFDVTLTPAQNNTLRIEAVDRAGNANSAAFTTFVDVVAPIITLAPDIPAVQSTTDLTIAGNVSEIAALNITLNGEQLIAQETRAFNLTTALDEGTNTILITAADSAGNTARLERTVSIDTLPPELEEIEPLEDTPFYYEGRATDSVRGKTEPGATVHMFIAGIFVAGRTVVPPNTTEIIEKAQFTTTADANGFFEFEDVDFEHPGFGPGEVVPREVQPGVEGLRAAEFVAQQEQPEGQVPIGIVVVDEVGLTTTRGFTVSIGTCFSGFFDFVVKTVPDFQTPSILSPQRLDSGTEITSFVLNTEYRGRASNNLNNPRANQTEDNFFDVSDVILEPACRDNKFLERNPSYEYACQIMRGRPSISRPVNVEQTNWYFRYNLGATDKFTNFDPKFWKALLNNELRFPFQISINYREKLPGRPEQQKVQTLCRDVSYFVDVPIDPRKVLPDLLLDEGQKITNETINVINKILPPLEQVIQYAGIGCMGSFGVRLITQIYRRFIERWEFLKCQAGPLTGGQQCPVTDFDELNSCYYISEDGKAPYPQNALTAPNCPRGTRLDLEQTPDVAQHFSGTISAWKAEAQLYQAYRWLCDRVFCHAAPAGWTQEAEIEDIRQKTFEQQQCANDASSARTLVPVENCYEELAERQNVLNTDIITTRSDLLLGQNTCYALGNAIYRVTAETDTQTGAVRLQRIDAGPRIPGGTPTTAQVQPDQLWATKIGNTYYTSDTRTCTQVCATAGSGWVGQCLTEAEGRGQYPAGPTSDCWVGTPGFTQGKQCYCKKEEVEERESRTAFEQRFGAKYAGTETGTIESGTGESTEEGEWPWNYREWQIQRSTNSQAGIYYPPERYYSGRDRPAAFGQNYLLDYINPPPSTPEVNPFTQHIGAFQSVCLTGIRGRLLMLRSILQGFQNCLKQIQTTGRADAGVCKEIFSQFVCNLAYKTFTFFQDQCVPEPFSAALGNEQEPDIQTFLREGSSAVTDTMQSAVTEVQDEYGNAQLNQYLAGGTEALMKKVCLAAFGIETGFDFNNFIDAAYSVPFVTSAAIFSSEGAVGRREFLSFNPQNLNSVYEYRGAWTIFPGCDLESYTIELAAVTEREAREHPNIDCSAVNNFEPGTNGCDNFRGTREITHPFFAGGRVTQGVYVDENKATNIEDPFRFDHFRITLFADPRWDATKCFPAENRVGNTAVFYFPMHDATAKDLLQCDVSASDGKFFCSVGADLSALGQAFIEEVQCFDPRTEEFRRCDRVTLALEENDPVKARVLVFSSGQNKICLDSSVQTQNAGLFPDPRRFIEVPGLGRPSSMPIDVNLIDEIDDTNFRGTGLAGIDFIEPTVPGRPTCGSTNRPEKDATAAQKSGGILNFRFTSAAKTIDGKDQFSLSVSGGRVEVVEPAGFSIVNGQLKKGNQQSFTNTELGGIVYRVNGYGITAIVPDSAGVCQFRTISPTTQAGAEQTWRVKAKLFFPDQNNECSDASPEISKTSGVAFDVEKTVNLRVRERKTETAQVAAYQNGKRLYNMAVGQDAELAMRTFRSALEEFRKVWTTPPARGSREEFLSYWWAVAALAEMHSFEVDITKKSELKAELLQVIAAFTNRLGHDDVKENVPLINSAEVQTIIAYLGEIEKKFTERTGLTPKPATEDECGECEEIKATWTELIILLQLPRPVGVRGEDSVWYFNPDTGQFGIFDPQEITRIITLKEDEQRTTYAQLTENLKLALIAGLRESSDARAISLLLIALGDTGSAHARSHAARALADIAGSLGRDAERDNKIITALEAVRSNRSEDITVRRDAAIAVRALDAHRYFNERFGRQIITDATSLARQINSVLPSEHTFRSDDEGREERFAPQEVELDITEKNHILIILNQLQQDGIRRSIGTIANADLQTGTVTLNGVKADGTLGSYQVDASRTELGGLVQVESNNLVFVNYEPLERCPVHASSGDPNCEYIPSDYRFIDPAVVDFHLHATNRAGDAQYAGPSVPDLEGADGRKRNGLVITFIGTDTDNTIKINVDYYTMTGVVVDLGNYDTGVQLQ